MAKKTSAQGKKSTTYQLGIDLGGTKILAALVDGEGKILGEAKRATRGEEGQQVVIERIIMTAKDAIAAAGVKPGTVAAAGIGAPGPVDVATGVVYNPPNLPGWDQVPLGPALQAVLGIPVFVDNDVNVGSMGEFTLGAGRGVQDMVALFVGTGVGGGVVVGGRLHRGFRGSAGEIGHMIVDPGGPVCGCGRRGCLEAFASRTAIERDVQAGLAAGRPSVMGDLLASAKRNRLTSGVIAKALEQQDALMIEIMARVHLYLGLAVANIVNFLDPEAIVFGGGVVESLGESFLEPVRQIARPYFLQQKDAEKVRIVLATLGDHAGVLGAAIMAAQEAGLRARP